MPYSEKQKKYFAWALHHPDQAAAEGKTPKHMSKSQMRDYATGPIEPKPPKAPKRKFYGE